MQVQDFGQWCAGQIAQGERDPQALTASYVDYVAGCVDRANRLHELKRLRAGVAAEIDQLETGDRAGSHYHLTEAMSVALQAMVDRIAKT